MTTNSHRSTEAFRSCNSALLWKAWLESRGRFFTAAALLASLVVYVAVISPSFLARYNARFPDKPMLYSVLVWSGLFHRALQGLWVLMAFLLTLGGLAREKSNGVALFTLGLPLRRTHLFLVRAAMAWAESVVLGITSALLIPVLSTLVGLSYPFLQALAFGALMSAAGLAILSFGLLISEIFEGEFTAPVVGLCVLIGYRLYMPHGWNVFDVMSAAASIDTNTQLLHGRMPWLELTVCLVASVSMLFSAGVVVRTRDL